MKSSSTKAPVSERALYARINRVLAKDGEMLCRCREDSRGYNELGRYYTIDANRNAVIGKHHDLEELGRELKVLGAFERLAD